MKSKSLVLSSIILVLFIISCTPEISDTTPTLTPADSKWGSIQPNSRVKEPAPNAEILSLLEKNKEATNYHYMFDADNADGYEVFILGSKVKKVYTDTRHLRGDIFYNAIYLDQGTRTALGICNKPGTSCSSAWNKVYVVDYDLENIGTTPIDIVTQVHNPQKVGSEVLMNRALTIIEYINADGNRELLSLDNYYGLPSRQVIYASDDDENIEESHTFTRLSVGEVDEEDVTLSAEYELQE
ncbi:MAG TPA: hypothetical protein VJI32_01460 [Candidatus Nanoarchaeia archaeon]|nr:hypothetical protein [Candidatus Nanoarchaeia archaeon]